MGDQPLKKEGYSQVKSLIESIENDRNADPFRKPVDWEGKESSILSCLNEYNNLLTRAYVTYIDMGLLDYPEIIQKPMDLSTVKEKLMAGKYATYEDAFNDV